eukprot:scaffold150856_cov54-Attheya_sp.AAC.4
MSSSDSLEDLGRNLMDMSPASHRSIRTMDSETIEKIAAVAAARGGSAHLVREQLESATVRRSHLPVPFSADVPYQPDEQQGAVPLSATPPFVPKNKVSIIGAGQVGIAAAYAMLIQGKVQAIALVDVDGEKLEGEAMDLRQGSAFYSRVRIEASTDYAVTANSDLIIVTAGTARRPGETRLDLVERNSGIVRAIIPHLLKHSPDAPICIVSNPCDVMTAVAARAAGPDVPPGRIFGSGTALDSSRLRSLVGASFDVDTNTVHGFVIGEHGDSSVPVWSSINVGGSPILPHGGEPKEAHRAMHAEVVTSGSTVIKKKGYTNWAIGLAIARITAAVVTDERTFIPVSTCVRGYQGVEEDVFLSLPCCLGACGVVRVIDLKLTEAEAAAFQKSAQEVWKVQATVWESWK